MGAAVGAGGGGSAGAGGRRRAASLSFPSPFQVYNVASGKALPQWLSDKKKRALRKDDDYR
jgi:hypothetical protein